MKVVIFVLIFKLNMKVVIFIKIFKLNMKVVIFMLITGGFSPFYSRNQYKMQVNDISDAPPTHLTLNSLLFLGKYE